MAPSRRALGAQDLWDASFGFWRVWMVHLGRRHGLLALLGRSRVGLTAPALARAAGLAQAPVQAWCDAAHGLGLLERGGARFRLAPALRAPLTDERSPDYLGGHLSYLALRSLDFDGFDELFRDGRPSARTQRHLVEAFAQATPWDHTAFLALVPRRVAGVRRALEGGGEVLDVGCGTGAWCLRVARAYPRARIRGVDLDPTPLRRARHAAQAAGLADRVTFDAGNVESRAYRDRFDIVHLGEVLCGASQDRALIDACRRALVPGGHLVVTEGLIDPARGQADPGNILVRAMQLEFALQPARFRTRDELVGLLGAAGFQAPRVLPAGGGLYFTVARAPTAPRSKRPR
jgi:SAM-dependent methyltransferase